MKHTIMTLALLVLRMLATGSEIDRLTTVREVKQFIVGKIDSNFIRYAAPKDSIVSFFKIDIDRNGLTDLFVNTQYSVVILDSGNGHYKRSDMDCNFISILSANDNPLLLIRTRMDCTRPDDYKFDTLTYKFGGFIEYNNQPDRLQIEKIHLKTHDGWPGINVELSLDSSRWATCERGYSPRIFAGIVDSGYFETLIQTINYIKLSSLANSYPIRSLECSVTTDLETFDLEIIYNSGQTKRIRDYGGTGTLGLAILYTQLVDLSEGKKLEELR